MRFELSATGDAWWDSLSEKQQKKYIEKHPRSKYAKKFGGGGGDAANKPKPKAKTPAIKAPKGKTPLKPKGKVVDKSKRRERLRKAKESVKRSQNSVRNAQNRSTTLNLYIDYLDNVAQIWVEAESRISTDRYEERINRKIDSANERKEKATERLSRAEQSIRKAQEREQRSRSRLNDLQTAAWSKREKLGDSLIVSEAIQQEIKATVKYLSGIKRYVSAKRKESINNRLERLRARNQKISSKKKEIKSKMRKAKD